MKLIEYSVLFFLELLKLGADLEENKSFLLMSINSFCFFNLLFHVFHTLMGLFEWIIVEFEAIAFFQ